mgnify:CR=1 FL=1
MKKLLGIIVLGLLWCNTVLSDITNGDLTTSWGYKSNSEQIEIVAYNANASQSLTITKIQIWYTSCDNIDNYGPNKVYDINRTVQPRSDKRIYKSAIIKHSGEMCSRISHSMNVSSSNKSITSKKKKKKKKTEENSTLVLLVVFGIIGLVIYMLAKKGQAIPSTSKISSIQKLPKNSVKILTITEFNKKIKSYIPGHQLSDLPRIGDVEGQEFQCGCGSSHIMNFDQHYFIADGGIYKAVFLSPDCKYLNALKLKGPMTSGIQNLFSTKYLANKPKYGFDDYPDIAGAIDKFFMR